MSSILQYCILGILHYCRPPMHLIAMCIVHCAMHMSLHWICFEVLHYSRPPMNWGAPCSNCTVALSFLYCNTHILQHILQYPYLVFYIEQVIELNCFFEIPLQFCILHVALLSEMHWTELVYWNTLPVCFGFCTSVNPMHFTLHYNGLQQLQCKPWAALQHYIWLHWNLNALVAAVSLILEHFTVMVSGHPLLLLLQI